MRKIILILLVLLLGAGAGVGFAQPSPSVQVKLMVNQVLDVLRGDASVEAKRQQVSGMIQRHLGIESLSRRTLGPYWRKGNKSELKRFQQLYIQLLERTYLNRISDFTEGRVDILSEKVQKHKAILETKIVTPGHQIPVRYKLILRGDVWEIYDVAIEGVSMVRSYRSSYNELLRKEGFEGLLKRMQAKLEEPLS